MIDRSMMTVREVAEVTGFSRGSVYGWMRDRLLPYVQFKGQRRIDPRDLEAFLLARRVG